MFFFLKNIQVEKTCSPRLKTEYKTCNISVWHWSCWRQKQRDASKMDPMCTRTSDARENYDRGFVGKASVRTMDNPRGNYWKSIRSCNIHSRSTLIQPVKGKTVITVTSRLQFHQKYIISGVEAAQSERRYSKRGTFWRPLSWTWRGLYRSVTKERTTEKEVSDFNSTIFIVSM